MKTISRIIKNIRNLSPYFLFIAIYFFFVNLEASKDKENNRNYQIENRLIDKKSDNDDNNIRIKIPVIPYNK